jgi:hypothetical protein
MKLFFAAALCASAAFALPASASQVCGWYAIATCTTSQADADAFMTKGGWGQTIDTNNYVGLKENLFCVVSGPQPKASAKRDMAAAKANGVAKDVYIKRACTDEKNLGD